MKTSPCKGCTDRVPAQCHKSCDRYIKWKNEINTTSDKMKDRDIDNFLHRPRY